MQRQCEVFIKGDRLHERVEGKEPKEDHSDLFVVNHFNNVEAKRARTNVKRGIIRGRNKHRSWAAELLYRAFHRFRDDVH